MNPPDQKWQIKLGTKDEKLVATVYGHTPEEAKKRANAIIEAVPELNHLREPTQVDWENTREANKPCRIDPKGDFVEGGA